MHHHFYQTLSNYDKSGSGNLVLGHCFTKSKILLIDFCLKYMYYYLSECFQQLLTFSNKHFSITIVTISVGRQHAK
jgi:hypothetical protein